MSKEIDDVKTVLEDAGFEVTDGMPGGDHHCARCGTWTDESRMGVCFPCGMLEDPESADWEIMSGILALYNRNHSLWQWLEGRKQWGKLYPEPQHIAKLERFWTMPISEMHKLRNM